MPALIPPRTHLRCGYCHAAARGLLEGCEVCGALLHAECRRELGRCSTLGCMGEPAQPAKPKPEVRIWWPSALAFLQRLVPLSLAAICVAGCLVVIAIHSDYVGKANFAARSVWEADAKAICDAVLLYRRDRGRDPRSIEELLGEGWIYDLDPEEHRRYRFVTYEDARWVAIEVEGSALPTGTLLLLTPLSGPGLGQAQEVRSR